MCFLKRELGCHLNELGFLGLISKLVFHLQMLIPDGRHLTQAAQAAPSASLPRITTLVLTVVLIEKLVIVRVEDEVTINALFWRWWSHPVIPWQLLG